MGVQCRAPYIRSNVHPTFALICNLCQVRDSNGRHLDFTFLVGYCTEVHACSSYCAWHYRNCCAIVCLAGSFEYRNFVGNSHSATKGSSVCSLQLHAEFTVGPVRRAATLLRLVRLHAWRRVALHFGGKFGPVRPRRRQSFGPAGTDGVDVLRVVRGSAGRPRHLCAPLRVPCWLAAGPRPCAVAAGGE